MPLNASETIASLTELVFTIETITKEARQAQISYSQAVQDIATMIEHWTYHRGEVVRPQHED